jgi:hypothetical protein
MTVRWLGLLTVIVLLTTSCGRLPAELGRASGARPGATASPAELGTASGARPGATASPSAAAVPPDTTQTASPARISSPSPPPVPCVPAPVTSFPPSTASSRNLVLAKLRGTDGTVVRDITDITRPSTVATLDVPFWQSSVFNTLQFVSATEISYGTPSDDSPSDGSPNQMIRMPVSGSSKTVVAKACRPSWILAAGWNPTGQSATYVVDVGVGYPFDWRLQTNGTDRSLSNPPPWCYCGNGSEEGAVLVAFSPNGQFLSMIDGVGHAGSDLQIRRIDGSLVTEATGSWSGVTMGVWSGDSFYFRDSGDVKVWHGGVIATLRAGLGWLSPKASPGGGQIVFYTRGSDGLATVSVIDTKSGTVKQLSDQARIGPVFLSSRYVWYQGERLCVAGDQCVFNHTVLTGKTYIYDLTTGSETESVITDVADVWPHGS